MLPSAAELEELLAEPALAADRGARGAGGRGRRTGVRTFMLLATLAAVVLIYLWNTGRLELPGFLAGVPVLDKTASVFPNATTANGAPASAYPGATDPVAIPPQVAESAGASLSFPDSNRPAGAPPSSASNRPTSIAAGVAARPAPSDDPVVQHFAALADTLEESIRNFHDRNDDFTVQRLTCDGLAVGYRAADDAFIALASAHRSARESLDAPRETRYRELVTQMGKVNEEFGASKCPRP